MPIPLTVIGTDATGQGFKERTFVLGLNGRDCQYQSKHEVQRDCCLLLDFEYRPGGYKPCRVQGRVKWLRASRTDRRLFHVGVELETFQSAIVVPDDQEDPSGNQDAPLARPVASTEPKEGDAPMPQMKKGALAFPQPPNAPEAAPKGEDSEIVAGSDPYVLRMTPKMATPSVVQESGHSPETLKNLLSREMQNSLQEAVASLDEQLRTSSESAAAMMAERLSELSQTAAIKIERDLNTRVSAMLQSAEEAITEIQGQINNARASAEDVLIRAQVAKEEAGNTTLRLRESLERVSEAANSVERLDESFRSRLDVWSAELKTRLDQVMAESTASWVRGMEEQMVPHLQRADERLQTLAAGMQLAQMQQDRLLDLSRTAAADFEKEMRALFLRLSANV
jgi:hypothetical protein